MESWNTPHTDLAKRILLLVRDRFDGECPMDYKGIAEVLDAKPSVVSTRVAQLIKDGRLVRTPFGVCLEK